MCEKLPSQCETMISLPKPYDIWNTTVLGLTSDNLATHLV